MIECCEITLPDAAAAVRLSPAAPETVVPFTCRNVLGRSFPGRAELKVFDERGAPVPTPAGFRVVNAKVEFEKGATQEIRCQLSSEGLSQEVQLGLQLRVYNDLAPNEEFSETPMVRVEFTPDAAERKPFPWMIVAVAGAVLVVGGAVVAIVLSRGKDDCQADADCAAGETCGAAHQCLFAKGERCDEATQCAGGACESGKCAELVATVGGSCGVAYVCPPKQVCDKSLNQCRGDVGFKGCSKDDQCVTGSCLEGSCNYKAEGASCDMKNVSKRETCPGNQRCTETIKLVKAGAGQVPVTSAACLLLPKQTCERDEQCTSQFCNKGSCNRDDMKCESDGECIEGFKCTQKQCVMPLGSACTPSDAANVLCEGGKCSTQSKTCVVANCGAACGPGTQCVNDRCEPVGRVGQIEIPKIRFEAIQMQQAYRLREQVVGRVR